MTKPTMFTRHISGHKYRLTKAERREFAKLGCDAAFCGIIRNAHSVNGIGYGAKAKQVIKIAVSYGRIGRLHAPLMVGRAISFKPTQAEELAKDVFEMGLNRWPYLLSPLNL